MVNSRAPRAGGRMVEGITLGRYVLLEELGSGGMGVVYAALDPELDRKVALKLLRNDVQRNTMVQELDRQRLLQEAQSMARLSHPNVVTIHDVGTIDGRVYLAMEYIDGTDMRHWLEDAPHAWVSARRLLLQAGKGLAAAHAAGLVHRDFKPDNVLIGTDGRAVVTDFGLAHAHEDSPQPELTSSRPRLTNPGVVMGTPAYMSPEQHRAQSVDPRSDQFSFCVVVYEAMYGQRPFSGRTRQAIALQAIRGKVRAPPPDVVVPEHVRRAVMRGLSTDPGRRWPDMKALLEALDRDPADRKRWGLRAAVAMAGLAGTVTALTFWPGDSAPTPVCEVTYDRVADTIVRHEPARNEPNPERKTEIERRLERWSTRWLEVRVEACRASRVTRTQSQALSGAQYECLDQRHRELEAALTRLDEVSEEQRSGTIAVLGSLSSPDRCADKALAQDEADLLALLDAGDRDRLAALVAIEAIARIVPLEEALAQVDGAAEGARDPRVSTRARWLEGELRRRTGDLSGAESLLHEAARRGAGADDQELLVRAWTSLTALAADRGDRSADGERWARYATAALSRHGPDPRLAARLLTQTGRALAAAGRTREAAAHLISATEAWQRLPDADPFGTAETQLALAELALADARPRAAVETGRRALDLLGSAVGPDHPARAPAELLVGRCELALDRPEQARTLLEHARRIARSPGDRFDIAIELARLALREDERDGAAELLRAALRAPDHPTQGQALARAQFLLGKALAGDRAPTGEARELGLSALESLDLQSPGQARLADAIDDWLGEHTEPSRPAGDEAPP